MSHSAMRYAAGVMAAALLAGLSTPVAQAAPSTCAWTVRTLPAAAGYGQSYAWGTDHGTRVYGDVSNDFLLHTNPAIWSLDGSTPPQVLPLMPGSRSTRITAMNAAGVAVGIYSVSGSSSAYPMRYANGVYQALPLPPGTGGAGADDINAAGDIVGDVDDNTIIVWPADRPGTYTLLPKAAGDSARAMGIDDARNVIGQVDNGSQDPKSYVWNAAGQATLLPASKAGAWVNPAGIRNGRVLGTDTGLDHDTVVVYDLAGHVLWRLTGHVGKSINATGLVSGYHQDTNGPTQKLLNNGAVVAVLPASFSASNDSSRLNDDGWVAGYVNSQATVVRCS
ncbi:MAG TPA: hypothetical protein VL652_22125 [Kutzneria sp.]|nr:hypothetical protein [Kutzneria sp.]